MTVIDGWFRRTCWLLLGAAIGLAAAALVVGLAQLIAAALPVPVGWLIAGCAPLAAGIGLLPGIRDLEITAARQLLRPSAELFTPPEPTWQHRWRTVGWVVTHLLGGLLAAVLLIGLVPGIVALVAFGLGFTDWPSDGLLRLAAGIDGPVQRGLLIVLAVLALAGCLLIVVALGLAARRSVGWFLGPTADDRLAVAEARLAAETAQTTVARELHDGIGHALTIISVQAAAGRHVLDHAPEQAGTALAAIEAAAQQALTELDDMLAVLRRADGHPAVDDAAPGGDLEILLVRYRDSGLSISRHGQLPDGLPRLVRQTICRIVAEGLANAQRYADPARVDLSVQPAAGQVQLRMINPIRPGQAALRPGGGGGRGLIGIRERVALFNGEVNAGPTQDGDHWLLQALVPLGRAAPERGVGDG